MKSIMKKLAVAAVMATALSAGVWANGAAENAEANFTFGYGTVNETEYLPLQVQTNKAIQDFFTAKGIDKAYLDKDLTQIPIAVRDSIDDIVKDDIDNSGTLKALVRSELKKNLKKGTAEYVYMMTGRYKWTLFIDSYDDGVVL